LALPQNAEANVFDLTFVFVTWMAPGFGTDAAWWPAAPAQTVLEAIPVPQTVALLPTTTEVLWNWLILPLLLQLQLQLLAKVTVDTIRHTTVMNNALLTISDSPFLSR
jgi:hypothetical protein